MISITASVVIVTLIGISMARLNQRQEVRIVAIRENDISWIYTK